MVSWISAILQAWITCSKVACGLARTQVVVDRAGEEHGLLRHHAEVAAAARWRASARMSRPSSWMLPSVGQIKALQQLGQRALAAARRAHQRPSTAPGLMVRLRCSIQVGQVLRVAEAETAGSRCGPGSLAARAAGDGVGLGRGVHDVAQALDRDLGLLELLPQADQAQHRLRQPARRTSGRRPACRW